MTLTINRLYRIIRHGWQRIYRGWDDSELWSLDVTFCCWVVPRLRRFKDVNFGYPAMLTMEQWNEILDQMIDGFTIVVEEQGWPIGPSGDTRHDRVDRAFELFGEWAGALWT